MNIMQNTIHLPRGILCNSRLIMLRYSPLITRGSTDEHIPLVSHELFIIFLKHFDQYRQIVLQPIKSVFCCFFNNIFINYFSKNNFLAIKMPRDELECESTMNYLRCSTGIHSLSKVWLQAWTWTWYVRFSTLDVWYQLISYQSLYI